MTKATNSKLTASLNRSLQRIADDQFDEFDIKLLLIDMREYLRGEGFLREVADFVAHPERERGICHKSINTRYAKIKMAAAGAKRVFGLNSIAQDPNKPDQFYTDQILNYISLPRISKADYQLFVLDSLDGLTDEILIKYYNLNRRDVHQLLANSFTKDSGFYQLHPRLSFQEVRRLDDLLKFIRGTVLGSGAISYDSLQHEFSTALTRIAKELHLASFKAKPFRKKFDAIFICLLALMHDAVFRLYDGEEARAYLSLHRGSTESHDSGARDYVLILMAKTPEVSFPIITSDIGYTQFIEEADVQASLFELQPVPWVHTKRTATGLILAREATA